MTIESIKVGELLDFIQSDKYKSLNIMPISPERAISQYHNPDADKNDVALLYARDEYNHLLGFTGILPGKINHEQGQEKFFWNSCWWVDTKRGRNVAMPLFFKFLKTTGNKNVFFDLTPRTSAIIGSLPNYTVMEKPGKKYFLHSPLETFFKKKNKDISFAKPFVKVTDFFLSYLFTLFTRKTKLSCSVNEVTLPDNEIQAFIAGFMKNEAVYRDTSHFSWIVSHPWLSAGTAPPEEDKWYPFSRVVQAHGHKMFKLKQGQEVIAFLTLMQRDLFYRVPYLYCKPGFIEIASQFILKKLLENKAREFTCFQPGLIECLDQYIPAFLGKSTKKNMGFPTMTEYRFLKEKHFQDGDGDVVFA